MRIFYTTQDFIYKGRPCQGIPFLCDNEMEFISVVNDYLLWISLENANTTSPATWQSYAETLYDYFSWLSANNLAWNTIPSKGPHGEEISNLSMYRNWSTDLVDTKTKNARIEPSTIRKRLSQIMNFYRWAERRKWISSLPWERSYKAIAIRQSHISMYRHTYAVQAQTKEVIYPKVQRKLIPLLRLDQCRSMMKACRTETLQLMTKLMLQSGLRNVECRTFPRKYIFDPSNQDRNRRIPIELSPNDMTLKGNKARRIYVCWQLMKELFDYLNFGEGAQRARLYRQFSGLKSSLVFLNHKGTQWSDKGLNNAYRKLWAPDTGLTPSLSFRVTPHMLRHTFATLELYAESRQTNIAAALAWVRDRLGHSSINTTTIYIHCLDLMGEVDLNLYQREIDALLVGDYSAAT